MYITIMYITIVMLNRRGEPITNEPITNELKRGMKMKRVIDVDIGFAPMDKKSLQRKLDRVRDSIDAVQLAYEPMNPSYAIDQIETAIMELRRISKQLMEVQLLSKLKNNDRRTQWTTLLMI